MLFFLLFYFFCFFFFFQAEDGIRDTSVTGVQTCALPICEVDVGLELLRLQFDRPTQLLLGGPELSVAAAHGAPVDVRSEERRVGKECRSGWWPDAEKKKKE